jgi:hypothetical protein
MDATRHALAREPIEIDGPRPEFLDSAESLEEAGNWYLAGETYRRSAKQASGLGVEIHSRLLVKAAACFEVASQHRAAARAYFDAASVLQDNQEKFQVAGELFNRAALLFRQIGEYFNAGDSWRRAGLAFSQIGEDMVSTADNLPPVPGHGGRFTVAGCCYTAAGDAYSLAGDDAMWACMAYWEAGRSHSRQGHGYHAFVAYRKALVAEIRFYGTHDRKELRGRLPLTEEERAAKLDPLSVMEDEAFSGNQNHQRNNAGVLKADWARVTTHRQVAAAFHEFHLAFSAIGNGHEAGMYRTAEKERVRQIMIAEHRYGPAILYSFWAGTSNYGESLGRWAFVCAIVLAGFSLLYAAFGLIEPVTHWFDYVYFSVVTFTSLGYGDIHPVGVAGKMAACLEIISGLVMFGVLLSFIGNRFQRT